MQSWKTFGHNRVKDILDRQLQTGRLPHAYLFAGSEGLGKKTLALEFAKKLLKTENLEIHPDFQLLDAQGEILMDMALDFVSRLSLKPFVAANKLAIIDNAQNLNASSSNALLKTLEEPGSGTVIILIANSGSLLPTIVSRCQVFSFNPFSSAQLQDFSQAAGLKVKDDFLALSFGRPARLKRLSEDKDFFKDETDKVRLYRDLAKQTLGEKLSAVSGMAEQETPELRQNFLTWLLWQVNALKQAPGDFSKVRALANALLGLETNKNKKLVLQGLFLKI